MLCYGITRKKKAAEGWDLAKPESLKNYPFRGNLSIDSQSFGRYKQDVIRHYHARLGYLKSRGEKLQGDVDGLELEYAFGHIARLAGSKNRSLFHGLCGWFEMTFGPEQRCALLYLADKIEKEVDRDINIATLILKRD